MSCRTTAFRLGAGALCLLAALSAGCVSAKKTLSARYGAADDSFHVLTVYAHIRSAEASDHDWLAQLWKDRERLIFPAAWIAIFDEPACLRISDHEYQQIGLGRRGKTPPATERTTLPLDKITIVPGEFFLSPEKTLCYYHRLRVPGEVVDAILALENKSLAEGIAQGGTNELARRKKAGKTKSWKEARQQVVAAILQINKPADTAKPPKEKAASEGDADNPLMVLDETSLGLLRGLADDGPRICWREKGVFHTALSLSAPDCREAKATFDAAKEAMLQLANRDWAAKQPNAKDAEALLRLAEEAVRLDVQEAKGVSRVVATIDVAKLTAASAAREAADFKLDKPDDGKEGEYERTLAAIRGHEIPIRQELDVARLVREFATPGNKQD
jgi:hypothetical protein